MSIQQNISERFRRQIENALREPDSERKSTVTPYLPKDSPFYDAVQRSRELAGKMERLEAELDTERQRRIVAEKFVDDLIEMIPVVEETS